MEELCDQMNQLTFDNVKEYNILLEANTLCKTLMSEDDMTEDDEALIEFLDDTSHRYQRYLYHINFNADNDHKAIGQLIYNYMSAFYSKQNTNVLLELCYKVDTSILEYIDSCQSSK